MEQLKAVYRLVVPHGGLAEGLRTRSIKDGIEDIADGIRRRHYHEGIIDWEFKTDNNPRS